MLYAALENITVRKALQVIVLIACSEVVVRAQDNGNPEIVIERLISFGHGINERMMDANLRSMLQEVKDRPEAFVSAIEKILRLPADLKSLEVDEACLRIERALQLSRLLGPRHGGNAVRAFYDETVRRSAPSELDEQQRRAIGESIRRLRWQALQIMGAFKDAYAADRILNELEQHSTEDQFVPLEYLVQIADRRVDLLERVVCLYEKAESRWRNNPQLKRVLDAMDAAERGKKLDSKDAESRPEGERKP